MKWSYKTVHFELKKEGLLGGSFLDEAEIEEQLNDVGRSGGELISVREVQDGIIAFFKQSLNLDLRTMSAAQDDVETECAADQDFEPLDPHQSYLAEMQEPEQDTTAESDDPDSYGEESLDSYQVVDYASNDVEPTLSEEVEEPDYHGQYQNQTQNDDEPEPAPRNSGIGAIKIE